MLHDYMVCYHVVLTGKCRGVPPTGGGHSWYFVVGVCCPALQILTLDLILDKYL